MTDLKAIREKSIKLNNINAEIESIETLSGVSYDGVRVQSSPTSSQMDRLAFLTETRSKIQSELNSMASPCWPRVKRMRIQHQILFELFYMNGLDIKAIASRTGFNQRQVYNKLDYINRILLNSD